MTLTCFPSTAPVVLTILKQKTISYEIQKLNQKWIDNSVICRNIVGVNLGAYRDSAVLWTSRTLTEESVRVTLLKAPSTL